MARRAHVLGDLRGALAAYHEAVGSCVDAVSILRTAANVIEMSRDNDVMNMFYVNHGGLRFDATDEEVLALDTNLFVIAKDLGKTLAFVSGRAVDDRHASLFEPDASEGPWVPWELMDATGTPRRR